MPVAPAEIESRSDFEAQVADALMDVVQSNDIPAEREDVEKMAAVLTTLLVKAGWINIIGN